MLRKGIHPPKYLIPDLDIVTADAVGITVL
jgi:hypothetical protein